MPASRSFPQTVEGRDATSARPPPSLGAGQRRAGSSTTTSTPTHAASTGSPAPSANTTARSKTASTPPPQATCGSLPSKRRPVPALFHGREDELARRQRTPVFLCVRAEPVAGDPGYSDPVSVGEFGPRRGVGRTRAPRPPDRLRSPVVPEVPRADRPKPLACRLVAKCARHAGVVDRTWSDAE